MGVLALVGARPTRRALPWITAAMLVVALVVVALDLTGWQILRAPLQSLLTARFGRPIVIGAPFEMHLRRHLVLTFSDLQIAAPGWSNSPYFVDAHRATIGVSYRTLLDGRLRIAYLMVDEFDVIAERDALARASWHGGDAHGGSLPAIGSLAVRQGRLAIVDNLNALTIDLELSTREGSSAAIDPAANSAWTAAMAVRNDSAVPQSPAGLQVRGAGTWHQQAMTFTVQAPGLLPLVRGEHDGRLILEASSESTRFAFDGRVSDLMSEGKFHGKFSLSGRSLGELGKLPGLTLPSTPAYEANGDVKRSGPVIDIALRSARIGSSDLAGAVRWDAASAIPVLSGQLDSKRLVLQDLGPAIGGDPTVSVERKTTGRALPQRPFDIASLAKMTANVELRVQELFLGTRVVDSLTKLRTRLVLRDGRIQLQDLQATLGGGTFAGTMAYGRTVSSPDPRWDADLRWNGVSMSQWLRQSAARSLVGGSMNGQAIVWGTGQSTAAVLGSMNGAIRTRLVDGQLSKKVVELAGLDIARALGVMFTGDELIPISCAAVEFVAQNGTLTSRVGVIDTPEQTFFADGQVRLREERLDLRLIPYPRNWSPLSLRSPLTVKGTLARPVVGVEAKPLAIKALATVTLAALNPLASLLALMEFGETDQPVACSDLIARVKRGGGPNAEKPSG